MTLAPGTRVRFVPGSKPQYLSGCTATVVQKQPGEPRYLVDVDASSRARRFSGGRWCVHKDTLAPVTEGHLQAIDERAKRAAEQWLARIAPRIEDEASRWAESTPGVDRETYFALHHPALLWRFYYHLSALLSESGKGWEKIYHHALEDDEREVEGS